MPPKPSSAKPGNGEEKINLNGTGNPPTTAEVKDQAEILKAARAVRQGEAEQEARKNQRYYQGYPAIRGEICEFCGINYRKCEHYKDGYTKMGERALEKGQAFDGFVCLCGKSKEVGARQQISLLYVPHRGYFVCDSLSCHEKYVERAGGVEEMLSWHFFRRDMPLSGQLIADQTLGR